MGLLDRFVIYHIDAPGQVRNPKGNDRLIYHTLHHRCNLTLISNVYIATPISLLWALNGCNKLLEMCFEFSLQYDWQIDNSIFNRHVMVCTEILVHNWDPE